MSFSIKIYDERNALIERREISSVDSLDTFEDDRFYRVMVALNDTFLNDLKKKAEIETKNGAFFFKSIKIDKLTLVDRFDAKNRTTLWLNNIQRLRGKEIKYLGELVYQKARTILQLKKILTNTGDSGQAEISVDWLCAEPECTNLSVPCPHSHYCPVHCKICRMYKDCSLISLFRVIDQSTLSLSGLLDKLKNTQELFGRLDEKTIQALLYYRIYNDFLKTLEESDSLEAARACRFALVSEFLSDVLLYPCDLLFEIESDIGRITRRSVLDLCEWGVIKFINEARGYIAALILPSHFAYGFFGAIQRLWRQHPNVIIIENKNDLQVCRSYYSGLYIQTNPATGFWDWFQRLEAAIYKETSEEKSRKIGKEIYEKFGEEMLRTLGTKVRIIDYGGGTGTVLRAFLELFLNKVSNDTVLEIKIIDVDKLSLDFANKVIPELLEKYGFHRSAFATVKGDIFNVTIERADIALISQVLDLYTEILSDNFPRTQKFSRVFLDFLENVLRDKIKMTFETGQQWKYTLRIAESLLSPYYFMVAKAAGLTNGEFDSSKAYLIKLGFQSGKIRWIKEIAKYSQHMIIADRVIDAHQLREWNLRAYGSDLDSRGFHLSKSSRD
jgi:hypothetical protein